MKKLATLLLVAAALVTVSGCSNKTKQCQEACAKATDACKSLQGDAKKTCEDAASKNIDTCKKACENH